MSDPNDICCWTCTNWHHLGSHANIEIGSCEIPGATENPITTLSDRCNDWTPEPLILEDAE